MEINNNKFSKEYEYSIFMIHEFKKPTKYILCFRKIKMGWIDRVIFKMNDWKEIDINGWCGINKKRTFITESVEEINEFMEWNIKKDNYDL
jgi:hypothetical protein